jgi:hypothetical protein
VTRAWALLAGALALTACGGGGGARPDAGHAGADATAGDGGGAAGSGGDATGAAGSGAAAAPDGADAQADGVDGADGGGGPLPAWKSGTRLRARLLKAADSDDAIFQGIQDSDLGVSCAFVRAGDGGTRCMPPAAVAFYDDGTCQSAILPMTTGCAPDKYVSLVDACLSRGHEVGPKVTPAKVYARSPGGACVEVLGDTRDFYKLTAVADSRFVPGAEHLDDRDVFLQMRYWKSDDGGFFPIGAWDLQRGFACAPGAYDYEDHCVPAVVAPASRSVPAFSDTMCKNPVGYLSRTCATEPVTAVGLWAADTCGQTMYFAKPTKLATMPYRSQGPACFPWTAPPAYTEFYTPGETITIGELPGMPAALEGAGRLKVRRYDTACGVRMDVNTAFYDSVRKGLCIPERTTKGLRCMPANAYAVTFFADDKCASPVHLESKIKTDDPRCAVPRPEVLYVDRGGATCGGLPTLELYAVGAAITPTKLYRADSTMGCVADGTDPAANDVFGTTPATEETTPSLESVTE